MLLAILLTSAVRLRIGRRWWKGVHWLAYAAWPIALFHALGTGTDTRLPLQLALYAVCLATVVPAIWWRLRHGGPQRLAGRVWGVVASLAVPLMLVAFAAAGPLRGGWAKRADSLPHTPGQSRTAHSVPTSNAQGGEQ
ncbi:hypothetical protein [Streptomyces sp. ICBB 8177]|uniref:hypothetical protein n=1 Tax=Streptomyces sp. ICBB 8177 TaxID=563922 RepID=UPI0013052BFD|nr:hypothetical protein [Streptomyces sp. ICBB 8177]